MPELMSSLPITGLDGTLKRSKAQFSAHLKTGSLRDVAGIAGYVDGPNGKRWALVAILHHPNANAARPALDAMVDWVAQQP
jgi:D-alanyl-D-alanine carboxypeptidase/D-alanyl-D-alanine-endopeptidase (penicillin-binding protein 4)